VSVTSIYLDWAPATHRTLTYKADEVEGYGGTVGIELVRNLIRAFRNEGPPLATIDDAIRALEIIDAAYESSATGRRVDLSLGRGDAALRVRVRCGWSAQGERGMVAEGRRAEGGAGDPGG
jgi:hypothetical protein